MEGRDGAAERTNQSTQSLVGGGGGGVGEVWPIASEGSAVHLQQNNPSGAENKAERDTGTNFLQKNTKTTS